MEHLRPPPIRIPKYDENDDYNEETHVKPRNKKFFGRVILKIIFFTSEMIYCGVKNIYKILIK